MKEKATIYDFKRFCKSMKNCDCPLYTYKNFSRTCFEEMLASPDGVNEIILKWCKEHPVKTRQDKFLELFPNANTKTEFIDICPRTLDCDYACNNKRGYVGFDCNECKKSYWLAEAEE